MNNLEMITKSEDYSTSDMPPKLKKLFGTVNIPSDLDHKKEIRKISGIYLDLRNLFKQLFIL